jgi:hypothetical protein
MAISSWDMPTARIRAKFLLLDALAGCGHDGRCPFGDGMSPNVSAGTLHGSERITRRAAGPQRREPTAFQDGVSHRAHPCPQFLLLDPLTGTGHGQTSFR